MNNHERFLEFPSIKVTQPIGDFYIGSIKAKDLCEITKYDFRRLVIEEGVDSYLGIQRQVSPRRVRDIVKYVCTKDACFPTAVILAVPGICTTYNEDSKMLRLTSYTSDPDRTTHINLEEIAIVLDGQHRIAGLKEGNYDGDFEINVSIFVEIDIADQAYLFSTVNLAQTKVNKSLVYDLFDLAKKRSPQKTCHNIAVALDREENSPFYKRIKRLGVATEGRFNETITQSTFVQSLIQYVSLDPVSDRDLYLRNKKPDLEANEKLQKTIFRNMFIEEKDLLLTDIIWNYFDAVKGKWPIAWDSSDNGIMLNKTNGFKAFMRFLRPCYLSITSPGNVPETAKFISILDKIDIKDDQFTTDEFKPGSSGEGKLFRMLIEKSGLSS
jgi:DGQHR domain-containing protein